MDTHGSDYLQLLNHSPFTVIVSDEKDQLIFANNHAKETFGYEGNVCLRKYRKKTNRRHH